MLAVFLGLLALAGEAEASAELQLRAAGPVVLLVDGRPASVMSNLKMRAANLDPGVHDVRITGMFGKTLFEGEIDFEDNTIVHAEWSQQQLRIVDTTPIAVVGEVPPLEEADDGALDTGDVDEPAAPELDVVEAVAIEPDPAEVAAVDELDDADGAVADLADETDVDEGDGVALVAVVGPDGAVVPADVVAADPRLAIPAQAVASAAPPPISAPRRMRLELREGSRLEVVHGATTLQLEVRDGALTVSDGAGLTLMLE